MGAGTGTGTGRPPRNAAQRRPPAASATGTGSSTSSTDTGSTGIGGTTGGSIIGSSTGGTGTCGLRRGAAPRRHRRGSPATPSGQPTCPPLALDAPQLVPGTPQLALGVLHQPCHAHTQRLGPGSVTELRPPAQGTTCLEGGSFLLNFVGCAQCGRRDFVLVSNRAEGLQDGEEIVTYDHLCKNCHHLIARHEYTFSVVDDYQEYTMLCLLCGRAEDSISILPDDPRQMTPLF